MTEAQHTLPGNGPRVRKWILRLVLIAILAAVAAVGLYFALRPPVMPRTEIFSGVYLTVEDLPGGAAGSGRAMIVEVLWDTPGVRLVNRPFSYPVDPGDPASPQYRLTRARLGALPRWGRGPRQHN